MCKYTTDATDGPAPEVKQSLDALALVAFVALTDAHIIWLVVR